MAAAAFQIGDPFARCGVIDAKAAARSVDIEQSIGDHRTGSTVAVLPYLDKLAILKRPRSGAAVVGRDQPGLSAMMPDHRGRQNHLARGRRYRLQLLALVRGDTGDLLQAEQPNPRVLASLR